MSNLQTYLGSVANSRATMQDECELSGKVEEGVDVNTGVFLICSYFFFFSFFPSRYHGAVT